MMSGWAWPTLTRSGLHIFAQMCRHFVCLSVAVCHNATACDKAMVALAGARTVAASQLYLVAHWVLRSARVVLVAMNDILWVTVGILHVASCQAVPVLSQAKGTILTVLSCILTRSGYHVHLQALSEHRQTGVKRCRTHVIIVQHACLHRRLCQVRRLVRVFIAFLMLSLLSARLSQSATVNQRCDGCGVASEQTSLASLAAKLRMIVGWCAGSAGR